MTPQQQHKPPVEGLPPPAVPRHLELQVRFQIAQDSREQTRRDARAQQDAIRSPEEDAERFRAYLRETCHEVTSSIDKVQASPLPPQKLEMLLATLTSKVKGMEGRLTEATLFLPPYDVRRAQEDISGLRGKIESMRLSVAPRKKFAFSSLSTSRKMKGGKGATQEAKGGDEASTSSRGVTEEAVKVVPSSLEAEGPSPASTSGGCVTSFDSLVGCTLCLATASSNEERSSRDCVLRDLVSCTIRSPVVWSFLRLEGLRDCKVYAGPVAGPVYIERCSGCVIFVASRQLRLHTSHDCDLYVRAASGPVIEACHNLRFAPYSLLYAELSHHLESAGLAGGKDMWCDVKDFHWLKANVKSPHWDVLPPHLRVEPPALTLTH